MPPRDWRARIDDALQAARKIQRYVAGMTMEDLGADERTMDAVVKNFMVIGEAATHIPDEVRARHTRVPWDSMRDMRNVVVHEYFGLSVEILLRTAHRDIPALIEALEALLKAEG
jgi:uncharacterized protein with HEPN domain